MNLLLCRVGFTIFVQHSNEIVYMLLTF